MPRPPAKRARRKAAPPAASKDSNNIEDTDGTITAVSTSGENSRSNVSAKTTSMQRPPSARSGTNASGLEDSTTRRHQTPKTGRNAGESGSSKLLASASRSLSRGQSLASGLKRGDASSKAQKIATPAFDSSMLSNFRPRPRQPSILHLMEDEGSSELDSEAFLGSFDPEDESTPLNLQKRKSLNVDALPPTPSPRKAVQSPQSAKKRKLIAVEIPVRSSINENASHSPANTTARDDVASIISSADSVPLPRPIQKESSVGAWSQTMEPPMSSSVVCSPEKQGLAAAMPPPAHPASATQPHISTAKLRDNFLPVRPRRRQQQQQRRPEHADEFDLVSSEDDNRRGRQEKDGSRKSRSQKSTGRALRSNKQAMNKKVGRNTRQSERVEGVEPSGDSSSKKRLARPTKEGATYSRRRESEKENELYEASESPSEADPDSTPKPKRNQRFVSDELLMLTRKFAEIDKWELEFEDVSGEEDSL